MNRAISLLALVVATALFAIGCGGNGHDGMMTGPSGIGPGMGTTGAAFMSVTPQGGTTGVATSTPIVFRFGTAMGTGMEQYVDLHLNEIAGPVIPMRCGWS